MLDKETLERARAIWREVRSKAPGHFPGGVEDLLVVKGRVIAYLITSEVLSAEIWLAFRNDFKPDNLAVFYVDEIPILTQKTPEQLREIHKVKLVFPGCRVIQKGAGS